MLISLAASWNRKLAHDSRASDAFVTVNGGVPRVEGVLAVGPASSLIHPPEGVLIDCSLLAGPPIVNGNLPGGPPTPRELNGKNTRRIQPIEACEDSDITKNKSRNKTHLAGPSILSVGSEKKAPIV